MGTPHTLAKRCLLGAILVLALVVIAQVNAEYYSPDIISKLDGINGFMIPTSFKDSNSLQFSRYGATATVVGDFNCDGIPDIAIGCANAFDDRGAVWIVFGQTNFQHLVDPVTGIYNPQFVTDPSQGIQIIVKENNYPFLGTSLAKKNHYKKINGRVCHDLVIGAGSNTSESSVWRGKVYVIKPQLSFPPLITLPAYMTESTSPTASADIGHVIRSYSTNTFGLSVAAGDVNGQGDEPDIVIVGHHYLAIVYGRDEEKDPFPVVITLPTPDKAKIEEWMIDPKNLNVKLTMITAPHDIGNLHIGDLNNGDNIADLSFCTDLLCGVLYGGEGLASKLLVDQSELTGSVGFTAYTESPSSSRTTLITDVNWDGKNDVLFGRNELSQTFVGVYYGPQLDNLGSTTEMSFNGTNGVSIHSKRTGKKDWGLELAAGKMSDRPFFLTATGINKEVIGIFASKPSTAEKTIDTIDQNVLKTSCRGFFFRTGEEIYNGGIYVGDFNNDGYDDIFFSERKGAYVIYGGLPYNTPKITLSPPSPSDSLALLTGPAPVLLDDKITINTIETACTTSLVVAVINVQPGDVLSFSWLPSKTSTFHHVYNPKTGIMELSGGTQDEYQSALRTITFSTKSKDPVPRKIVFGIKDIEYLDPINPTGFLPIDKKGQEHLHTITLVLPTPEPSKGVSLPIILLVILILAVALAGGAFFYLKSKANRQSTQDSPLDLEQDSGKSGLYEPLTV